MGEAYPQDRSVRRAAQRAASHPAAASANQNTPFADPMHQALNEALRLGGRSRLVVGVIDDYTALAYCYRVRPSDGLGGPLIAVQLSGAGFGAFGAKDLGLYTPGTAVVLLKLSQSYAFILGAYPFSAYDPRRCLSDQLTYSSRSRVDAAHRKPITVGQQRNVINWIANRPSDIVAGTHGWIAPTGMRVTVNDAMAQLGAGDACGLTVFNAGMMARLAAYNFEFWSASRSVRQCNDQEELLDYEGIAVFPWEQLGLPAPGDPRRTLEPRQFQITEPHYSAWEPKHDDQRPFHRVQSFQGYLGQGGLRSVVGLPPEPPEQFRESVLSPAPGLSRDFTTLAGDRVIAAAHSVSLIKRLTLPNPERKRRAEDGRGDKPADYKHSGQLGEGPDHKVQAGPTAPGTRPHMTMAAAVMDMHAYLCNWSCLHPFHYHTLDFDVPEESEVAFQDGPVKTQYKFDYTSLRSSIFLDPPDPKKLKIDDRYGSVDFYELMSHFTLLPDGGISIGCGYGSEIRMVGGQLTLAAPNDILVRSGRSVLLWGGWDVVARAQNSVDISATTHDVRVKAGSNMQLLADKGGVLLESKASGVSYDYAQTGEKVVSSGIMFRAAKSEVSTLAKDIYLRTGSEDGSIGSGDIVFDANRGKGVVLTHARQLDQFLQGAANYYFGEAGNIRKAHQVTENVVTIAGQLYAADGLVTGGSILADGSLALAGGSVSATQGFPFVGELKGDTLARYRAQLGQQQQRVERTLPKQGDTTYQTFPQKRLYDDGKVGNDTVLRQSGFSFRSTEEYLASGFLIYEDRWQQAVRADNWTAVWKEKPVRTQNNKDTYPYPGREAYEGKSLVGQPLLLFDDATGYSKPRGTTYEDVQFAETKPRSLQEYPVIKQAE